MRMKPPRVHNHEGVDKILLVGDIHGDVRGFANFVDRVAQLAPDFYVGPDMLEKGCAIVQLGDWGVGWENGKLEHLGFPVFVVEGNHEHFGLLNSGIWEKNNPNMTHLRRGDVLCLAHGFNFACIGGADSIDKAWRTEGIDWFESEALGQLELERAKKFWKDTGLKMHGVLAHDVFHAVYQKTLNHVSKGARPFASHMTSHRLQEVYDELKPMYWFHGHHHTALFHEYPHDWVPFSDEPTKVCLVTCLDTLSNHLGVTPAQEAIERCSDLLTINQDHYLEPHDAFLQFKGSFADE